MKITKPNIFAKIIGTAVLVFALFINSTFAQTDWTVTKVSDVPAPVMNSVKQDYGKYSITSISSTEGRMGGIRYRIEVRKKKKVYRLIYNNAGILLSEDKIKTYTYDGAEKPTKSKGANPPPMMPPM